MKKEFRVLYTVAAIVGIKAARAVSIAWSFLRRKSPLAARAESVFIGARGVLRAWAGWKAPARPPPPVMRSPTHPEELKDMMDIMKKLA